MKKNIFLFLVLFIQPVFMQAQCAMCRAVLESEANQDTAQGINDGILYLMVFPYLLIGGLVFIIVRHFRKRKFSSHSQI